MRLNPEWAGKMFGNTLAWLVFSLLFVTPGFSVHGPRQEEPRRVDVHGFVIPESVAVGPEGEAHISDMGRNGVDGDGIIKVIHGDPIGGHVTVTDLAAGLDDPTGIVTVENHIFVVDQSRVWRIITQGERAREKPVFLARDDFPREIGLLNDIAGGLDGTFFISDANKGLIYAADAQGDIRLFFDVGPTNPLKRPNGVIVDSDGRISGIPGSVLVIDLQTGNLVAIEPDGSSGEVIARRFGTGDGLTFDGRGNLYVSNFLGGRIYRVRPDLSVQALGERFTTPADIAFDQVNEWLTVPSFTGGRVTFV